MVGVGEGRKDALFAVLGGVTGALVFTLLFNSVVAPLMKLTDFGKVTVASTLHVSPLLTALAIGAIFLAVVAMLPSEVKKAH